MNKYLKYLFYFIFGFIFYNLLFNKKILIEGNIENTFGVLARIIGEGEGEGNDHRNEKTGCNHYNCDNDIFTNDFWVKKAGEQDVPEFKLCNNEPGYSTASLIESDSESVIGKCSHNICCENLKCSVQLDHDACVGEDEIFEPNNNCRSYDICKNTDRNREKLDFCCSNSSEQRDRGISVGRMKSGFQYKIIDKGTTNFNILGANNNNNSPGNVFVSTGAGEGTGKVSPLGCRNYNCKNQNNIYNNWSLKSGGNLDSDSIYFGCTNYGKHVISDHQSLGECNNSICCENLICGNYVTDEDCGEESYVLQNKACTIEDNCTDANRIQYCCTDINIEIKDLFDKIKQFRNDKNVNSTALENDDDDKIYGKDILYYIYYTTLNLESMSKSDKNKPVLIIPNIEIDCSNTNIGKDLLCSVNHMDQDTPPDTLSGGCLDGGVIYDFKSLFYGVYNFNDNREENDNSWPIQIFDVLKIFYEEEDSEIIIKDKNYKVCPNFLNDVFYGGVPEETPSIIKNVKGTYSIFPITYGVLENKDNLNYDDYEILSKWISNIPLEKLEKIILVSDLGTEWDGGGNSKKINILNMIYKESPEISSDKIKEYIINLDKPTTFFNLKPLDIFLKTSNDNYKSASINVAMFEALL